MTSTAPEIADQAVTPTALLARVREQRAVADDAEAVILELAVEWAHAHPALPGDESWRVTPAMATNFLEDRGFSDPEQLEAYGIPEVHWAAPAAFAAANGMSTTAGKAVLRDALILRHRLPRTWAQLTARRLAAWRARRIARAVLGAPADVVAHIDQALVAVAPKVGPIQLDRLVEQAVLELHVEELEIAQAEALASRYARLDDRSVGIHGLADLAISGDWKDLHDFDRTLSDVAGKLQQTPEGEHESFDTLRSMAVGVLADPAQALALLNDSSPPKPSRHTVLYVHVTDLAVLGLDPTGRNEATGGPTLEQQIRSWCGRTDTHLTIKPVIGLNVEETVESYAVPDRINERTILRHPTCVFPWCTRPSRRCDCDHRVPHSLGGTTCDHNLTPLCRHHHRLKTHAGWRYTKVAPGVFIWSDPHHQHFLRDRQGTTNLSPT